MLREARAAAAIRHAHVVTLFDIVSHQGDDILVMELVEGRTLSEALRDGPPPLETALRWIEEVARALVAAHGRGILHRDIKAANIMIGADGVKVLDFGLAKLRDGDPVAVVQLSPGASLPGLGGSRGRCPATRWRPGRRARPGSRSVRRCPPRRRGRQRGGGAARAARAPVVGRVAGGDDAGERRRPGGDGADERRGAGRRRRPARRGGGGAGGGEAAASYETLRRPAPGDAAVHGARADRWHLARRAQRRCSPSACSRTRSWRASPRTRRARSTRCSCRSGRTRRRRSRRARLDRGHRHARAREGPGAPLPVDERARGRDRRGAQAAVRAPGAAVAARARRRCARGRRRDRRLAVAPRRRARVAPRRRLRQARPRGVRRLLLRQGGVAPALGCLGGARTTRARTRT